MEQTSANWRCWQQRLQANRRISGSWTHWRTIRQTRVTCQVTCPKHILQGDKSHVGIIPLLIFKYKVARRLGEFSIRCFWNLPQDVAVLPKKTKSRGHCLAAAHRCVSSMASASCALPQTLRSFYWRPGANTLDMGFALGVLATLLLCLVVADLV